MDAMIVCLVGLLVVVPVLPDTIVMTLSLATSMAYRMQCDTAGESTTPWAAGKRSLTKWAARLSPRSPSLFTSHCVCPVMGDPSEGFMVPTLAAGVILDLDSERICPTVPTRRGPAMPTWRRSLARMVVPSDDLSHAPPSTVAMMPQ